MKNTILPVALLFFTLTLSAQSISEGFAVMSQGNQNALYVFLPGSEVKDVETLWIKFARDLKGKTSKVKKTNELMTDDASIPEMSANTVDIYALATKEDGGVKFFLWFDLGGAYLSAKQHPDRIEAGKALMREFVHTVQVDRLETLVKEQGSLLKKLEKELSDAEKEVSKAAEALREAEQVEKTVRENIKRGQQQLGEYEAEIKKLRKDGR